jgi:hypothetical protein
MNWQEVKEMAASGLTSFGSHGLLMLSLISFQLSKYGLKLMNP